MPIDRTGFNAWVDYDPTGGPGTVLNKSRMAADILDPIDAALAPLEAGIPDIDLTLIHRRGTRAAQPSASTVPAGTLYGVTDEGHILERSNGTAWEPYAPISPVGAVFPYGFSTSTIEPPSAQQIRFNAPSPYTGVTKVWATFQDSASEDLYWGWMRIDVGSGLLVQDKDDHTRYAEFKTTGPASDKGTYVELPVDHVGHGTALAVQACLVRVRPPSVATQLAALDRRLAALEQRGA
jgi:hypothetical protein